MILRSFYFLRHGETDWNKKAVLQGHSDIPLNETGRRQAEDIIPVMKNLPIDRIVASTLARAHETARIINAVLKKPIIQDAALWERGFGDYEGMAVSEIESLRARTLTENLPPEENGYACPPNAETYEAFKNRTTAAIAKYLDLHPGENILFVAHGGIYRALLRSLLNDIGQSPNVKPYHFEKTAAGWKRHEV